MEYRAGLDWGAGAHAICVVEAAGGRVVLRFEATHDAAGLSDLLARLRRVAPPESLPVAIERPSGLVVDALIEAGHPVFPVRPDAVKACRPRYRAAGGKSDASDAYVLADILRTDGHRLTRLRPETDAVRALRALVRGRDDLVAARVALANQLRSLLGTCWPGAGAIFAEVDSPIALAFIARHPTAESASHLGSKRLARFLAQQRYSGRRSADELLARLRAAPAPRVGPAEAEASGEVVLALVATLAALTARLAELTARVGHAVAELPEGRIVMSFPRAGSVCAAQITAELGSVRERFASEDHLAAEAGVAPVTHASGKSRGVLCRRACNKRLRAAIACLADNSRHASAWAAAVYRRARERGCRHPHAIRILARAWVRVLWRAWRDAQAYDPAKHAAALAYHPTG